MKPIIKVIVSIVLFVVPGMAQASAPRESGLDDTIPAAPRNKSYYYTKWFDECQEYYPDGIVDSCFSRYFEFWNFYGHGSVAKWERTKHRMRVKGLVAMLDRYTPPTRDDDTVILKLPEYLYLYQLVGRHNAFDIDDGLDLVLVDSVRWDTATARVMELRRGSDNSRTQYCYLYEAYFENPVYIDSEFYIFGSTNSNVVVGPGSHIWQYVPTYYVDIMDWGGYTLNPKCDGSPYEGQLPIVDYCRPQGGWVAIIDCLLPELGWNTPWPDSPWGYYLAIVDQWDLDAVPNDTSYGRVDGGGRWPDDSYDTIEAVPAPGHYFDSWSDGSHENPRVVHLTSDTAFVAMFHSNETYCLAAVSSDEAMGTVAGGGTYHGGTDNAIEALPAYGYLFSHWNDGETANPRVVHLTGDTLFVAFFSEKERHTVLTASNNDAWGSVQGGGVYIEGEEATLTVTTEPFCLFEGWSDGDWHLPRVVTVRSDTLFTALFSFDSARAAGMEMAGDLAFDVTPNPTTGRLAVSMGQPGGYVLSVYDMRGRTVAYMEGDAPVAVVDMGALPAGQYLLVVRSRERYGIRTIVKR